MYASAGVVPWIMVIVFMVALIGLNEIARRSMWAGIFCFIILPVILTFTVWLPSSSKAAIVSWFTMAKVYSALAGCIGFMAIRYIKRLSVNKFALMFPPLILSINIMEAVMRDFQLSTFGVGFIDGAFRMGGPWNIMNGIAGILNIITICGWSGIVISKSKSKDMLWPDMLWFWIIAYDLWNFAFVYNNAANYSPYSGIALLLACTIPAFFIQKGAWLWHRASTLAFYMMWVMTFPEYTSWAICTIPASQNPTAYFIISLASLLANAALFVYQAYRVWKEKKNPLTEELYTDLRGYREVVQMAK